MRQVLKCARWSSRKKQTTFFVEGRITEWLVSRLTRLDLTKIWCNVYALKVPNLNQSNMRPDVLQ